MTEIRYELDSARNCLHILSDRQTEDFQIPMLRQNPIPGLLDVKVGNIEDQQRYTYDIGSMFSMKESYEKKEISKQKILDFIHRLLGVMTSLQQYMLSPDCLVLDPAYIFQQGEEWFFCYLPVKEEDFMKSFHTLTEYFLKTIDYGDLESICLSYELHRATLRERYQLDQVLKEYEEHEKERKRLAEEERNSRMNEDHLFDFLDEDPVQREDQLEGYSAFSEKTRSRNRFTKKAPKRKWGDWQDLIMETDGQEPKPNL